MWMIPSEEDGVGWEGWKGSGKGGGGEGKGDGDGVGLLRFSLPLTTVSP